MKQTIAAYVELIRPRQWIKNSGLFAPIFFDGVLFDPHFFTLTLCGFIALCFVSSSHYIINDILDVANDKKHPYKKFRPIARGAISVHDALVAWVIFLFIGFGISAFLGSQFLLVASIYSVVHYINVLVLRRLMLVDILFFSAGYALRLLAGSAATGMHVSIWLVLAAICLSLFLALGKRRSELSLFLSQKKRGVKLETLPEVLYTEKLLDSFLAMFATATFLTYSYFTFLASSNAQGVLTIADPSRKWLMISIPFVLYGIMRYLQLLYEEPHESMEKTVTHDSSMLVALLLWVVSLFLVLYGGRI